MKVTVENHLLLALAGCVEWKEKGTALGQCLSSNTICSRTEYSSNRLWECGWNESIFSIKGLG